MILAVAGAGPKPEWLTGNLREVLSKASFTCWTAMQGCCCKDAAEAWRELTHAVLHPDGRIAMKDCAWRDAGASHHVHGVGEEVREGVQGRIAVLPLQCH